MGDRMGYDRGRAILIRGPPRIRPGSVHTPNQYGRMWINDHDMAVANIGDRPPNRTSGTEWVRYDA